MTDFNYDCLKTKCTESDIDYKTAYEVLKAENRALQDKIACLEEIENEAEKMRAQLEIVYLIFGGK